MATNNAVNVNLSGQTGTGNFVGSGSPTITTPVIALIRDASGNPCMGFANGIASPDYITAQAGTGQPELQASGTSTNINFLTRTKAAGIFIFASQAPNIPFSIYNGTGYQHNTAFSFANTAASRTVTFQDADGTLAYLSDITAGGTITGAIIAYGANSVPTGYLACDGSAVSRTTYAALFAIVGTTWGAGDGSTTFNVPNLNRATLMGSGGSGTGVIGNAVGNTGGAETLTLPVGSMPARTGVCNAAYSTQSVQTGASTNVPGGAAGWAPQANSAVSIVQPSAIVKYLIKT